MPTAEPACQMLAMVESLHNADRIIKMIIRATHGAFEYLGAPEH
jgi:hypothetical protein